MKMEPEEQAIRQAHQAVMLAGALFVLGAFGYYGGLVALSVLCGVLIALGNLWLLSRSVSNLLKGQGGAWAGVALFKFMALCGLIYLLIESGWVEPIGLAVGFGALPVGILLSGVFGIPSHSPSLSESRPPAK